MAKLIKRCKKPYPNPIRASREFKDLIYQIQGRYLLNGKKAPSTSRITQIIADKVKREDLLKDEFIKF